MAINYTEYAWLENYVDAVVELISRVEGHIPNARDTQDERLQSGMGIHLVVQTMLHYGRLRA